jgi:hypothetical protein
VTRLLTIWRLATEDDAGREALPSQVRAGDILIRSWPEAEPVPEGWTILGSDEAGVGWIWDGPE